MATYSKLIGTIVGALVGILISWLAIKGLATCTNPADPATCTVAGLSTAQITGGIMTIIAALGTFLAPPNA